MSRILLSLMLVVLPLACAPPMPPPAVSVAPLRAGEVFAIRPNTVCQIFGRYIHRRRNPLYTGPPASPDEKAQPEWLEIRTDPVGSSVTTLFRRGDWVYGLTCKHVVNHPSLGEMVDVMVQGQETQVVVEGDIHDAAVVRWRPVPGHEYPTAHLAQAKVGDSARSVGWCLWGPTGQWPGLHIQRGWVTLQENCYIGFSGGVRPGMSGGALVDDTGALVGLLALWYPGCESFGYAVDSQYLQQFIDRIPPDK